MTTMNSSKQGLCENGGKKTPTNQMVNAFNILAEMRKDSVLCDVIFTIKNVEIPAHRAILAASSRYFYAMFTSAEYARKERIEINGEPHIILALINYMYTSKITLTNENVKSVLEGAKMLLLDDVQDECCKYINQMLCPGNCLGLKMFVNAYGSAKFLNEIDNYIDNHFIDVVSSQEFITLSYEQLSVILSRDTLRVPSEEKIYECVMAWVKHDVKNRRKYLRALMGQVRLTLIPKEYIKQHIRSETLVSGDITCKDIIIDALLGDSTSKAVPRCYNVDSKILLAVGVNTWEYYDFETKKWSKASSLGFGLCNAALVYLNNHIYAIIGMQNRIFGKLNVRYRIHNVPCELIYPTNSNGTLRRAVCLNRDIYMVGGTINGYPTNTVQKFDSMSRQWSSVTWMLLARRDFGITVLNDLLYVVGGWNLTGSLRSAECYNPKTETWNQISDMNECREGVAVSAIDDILYAVGGRDQYDLNTVEAYDSRTNSWTPVAPMATARSFAGVVTFNGKLYVVGGITNGTCLGSVEVYEPKSNIWTTIDCKNETSSLLGVFLVEKHSAIETELQL